MRIFLYSPIYGHLKQIQGPSFAELVDSHRILRLSAGEGWGEEKKADLILGQLFVCRFGQTKEWLHPEPGGLWGQQ